MHARNTVILQERDEMRHRIARIERRPAALLLDTINHNNAAFLVSDGDHRIIRTAAGHVHEGAVLAALFWWQRTPTRHDAGQNLRLIKRGALRCTRKIEMQTAIARTRQTRTLLFEIGRTV